MAGTTKLVTSNSGTKATAATVNPKFVTTPTALASFPASNMLLKDRAVRWVCPAAGSDVVWTVDLGQSTSINVVGLLGVQRPAATPAIIQVDGRLGPTVSCTADGTTNITRVTGSFIADGVQVGMTVTGTYMPAGVTVSSRSTTSLVLSAAATGSGSTTLAFGPLLPLSGSLGISGSDIVTELVAPVNVRYVTFTAYSVFSQWSVGKMLIGRTTDLGIAYSPGSSESILKRGVDNVTVEGARTFTRTGADGRKFSMQFTSVPDSVKSVVTQTVSDDRVVGIIHPVQGMFEAFVDGDEFEATHRWGNPDLWDFTLNLETLP